MKLQSLLSSHASPTEKSTILVLTANNLVQRRITISSQFQMWEKIATHLCIGHVIRRMRSVWKCILGGILWEISELIVIIQEQIAIGSSNLVEVLTV